jgi:zinc transport system substrate-binding protein
MISQRIIKYLLVSFFLLSSITLTALDSILVSVAPYKLLVERIVGDTVSVRLLVPAAASSHTYEPTPRQTIEASRSKVWFMIGEPFEERAVAAFRASNPSMLIVDLRDGIDLIYGTEHHCHNGHCHDHNSADLHYWLSPRVMKVQARVIADVLSRQYPQNKQQYEERLEKVLVELDRLDKDIADTLRGNTSVIMVSHPAYAYFCRDYGLTQLSIEFEGKDPTPQQLTRIIQAARKDNVKTIFVQKQYSDKGAQLIAKTIGAKISVLDPYAENYFDAMRQIALHFAEKSSDPTQ